MSEAKEPATERQVEYMRNLGITFAEDVTKVQAGRLIDHWWKVERARRRGGASARIVRPAIGWAQQGSRRQRWYGWRTQADEENGPVRVRKAEGSL